MCSTFDCQLSASQPLNQDLKHIVTFCIPSFTYYKKKFVFLSAARSPKNTKTATAFKNLLCLAPDTSAHIWKQSVHTSTTFNSSYGHHPYVIHQQFIRKQTHVEAETANSQEPQIDLNVS